VFVWQVFLRYCKFTASLITFDPRQRKSSSVLCLFSRCSFSASCCLLELLRSHGQVRFVPSATRFLWSAEADRYVRFFIVITACKPPRLWPSIPRAWQKFLCKNCTFVLAWWQQSVVLVMVLVGLCVANKHWHVVDLTSVREIWLWFQSMKNLTWLTSAKPQVRFAVTTYKHSEFVNQSVFKSLRSRW